MACEPLASILPSGMDLEAFVGEHLPPAPARVLEVGCGGGELTRAMAGHGYDVLGIDPEAPAGELFEPVSLEEFGDPAGFDAVVACRSLHHIDDLGAALDKASSLLRPGGRLLVYEHAPDRMDERTARWYREHAPSREHSHSDWAGDHAGLHGYAAIRAELDRRFSELVFAWAPYLYRELGSSAAEEQALIEAGAINAIGFVYVGEARES